MPENSKDLADLKLCIKIEDPSEDALTIVINGWSGDEIYNENACRIIYL